MTRLVRRISRREVVPGRAGAQHPEDAIEDRARLLRRPAATIGTSAMPEQRLERLPLSVSKVHAVEYDGGRSGVTNLVPHF